MLYYADAAVAAAAAADYAAAVNARAAPDIYLSSRKLPDYRALSALKGLPARLRELADNE